jgi:cytochrome c oxidase subunit II
MSVGSSQFTDERIMSVPWAAARRPRSRPLRRRFATLPLIALLAFTSCEAGGGYPQTTFRPVSEFGDALNRVFYNTFGWTMGILILVMGLIIYATLRFRERPGAPQPEQIHGNTKLEIMWTIAPALIVVFIGVPTVQTIFDTQRRPPDEALVVEVVGHQWWWEFRYPEYDIVTANQMWIPTGRPISLQMHSADVIHSFWIPKIGGKRDVNPLPRRREGEPAAHKNYLLFEVREPGHYLGQCAEFCGESHAIMRMTVMAVEPADFDAWAVRMRGVRAPSPATAGEQGAAPPAAGGDQPAGTARAAGGDQPAGTALAAGAGQPAGTALAAGAGQPAGDAAEAAGVPAATAQAPAPAPRIGQMPTPTGVGNPFTPGLDEVVLQQEGERIFLGAACVACHAIAGTTAAGVLGPRLTMYGQRPWVGAGAAENSLENLIQWIKDPQSLKPGTLMPGTLRGGAGMPPTGLTDAEVRAVAAYLLSLK